MACVAQALEIRRLQHPQCVRTLLLDPPAELLLDHELIEEHHIRLQLADKYIKTAVVERDVHFTDAQTEQIGAMLALGGRAGKGDLPVLLQKALNQLHHVPAGGRRSRLGPYVADDQQAGAGRLIGAVEGSVDVSQGCFQECFLPCRATGRWRTACRSSACLAARRYFPSNRWRTAPAIAGEVR